MKTQRDFSQTQRTERLLYQALAVIKTESEAESFLQDLCTPAEIQAMADRWQVVEFVKQGMPYRQIHEKTGVSVTTIGRVARSLMLGEGGYNLIYQRVKKNADKKSK